MDSSSDDAILKELKDLLKKLYKSGAYSDLTVICGGDVYKVHKAIICPRSDFFSSACRDGAWKEGETGQITLHQGDLAEADVEAQLVGWLMYYFYHFDYLEPAPTKGSSLCKSDGGTTPANELGSSSQEPRNQSAAFSPPIPSAPPTPSQRVRRGPPPPPSPPTPSAPPPPSQRVRRGPPPPPSPPTPSAPPPPSQRVRRGPPLPPSPSEFSPRSPSLPRPQPREPITTRTNPLTHAQMYAVADFYCVSSLKELANKKFRDAVQEHWDSNDFVKAVEVVYTTTPSKDRGLRQVVKYVLKNHTELLDKPEIDTIIKQVPDLSYDVLRGIRGIQEDEDEKEDARWEESSPNRVQCAQQ